METSILQKCTLCGNSDLDPVDPESDITRCRVCGYIFHNPQPSENQLVEFYSRPTQYDSWLEALESRDRLWKRRLGKLVSRRKTGSLLDVGTGIGQFLSIARNFYSPVHGTEVSRTALQIAKQRYGLDLYEGTIEDLKLEGKQFDNITLFHVLEHVPDPRCTIRTCYSLLNKRGILVIAIPNQVTSLRSFWRRGLMAIGLRKKEGAGKLGLRPISMSATTDEIHLSYFTPRVMHQLLEKSGFSIISSTLDPFYVANGMQKLKEDLYYFFCLTIRYIFKINIYDALLVISRKNDAANSNVSRVA